MTKQIEENFPLVAKVSITNTLRNLPVGKPIPFKCSEAGLFSSAQCAVSRLNKAAGRKQYAIESTDNGITYTVTRFFA